MRIIAASEDTGALKLISALHGTDTSKPKDEENPKFPKITTHAEENNTRRSKVIKIQKFKDNKHIVVARLNGSVEIYQILKDATDLTKFSIEAAINKEKDQEQDKNQSQNQNQNQNQDEQSEQEQENLLPLLYKHENVIPPFIKSSDEIFINLTIDDLERIILVTNKGSVFIWNSKDDLTKPPMKFNLPLNTNENVEAFQVHPGKDYCNYVAYGGKETDLKIVKLPTDNKKKLEIVFKAKNVSDSKLDLRVPIHIKCLLFDIQSTPDNFKLYTFTAVGDLRYYESKIGRKPRSSVLILPKKAPITEAIWIDNELVVCDNRGIIVKVNPQNGAQLSQFKGQIGSIQSLSNFKDTILATTGVDRYVRAYDNKTRKCLVKVFIGTQSNALTIVEDEEHLRREQNKIKAEAKKIALENKQKKALQEDDEEESSDEEELWNKLDANNEVTHRRKRRKLTLAK